MWGCGLRPRPIYTGSPLAVDLSSVDLHLLIAFSSAVDRHPHVQHLLTCMN